MTASDLNHPIRISKPTRVVNETTGSVSASALAPVLASFAAVEYADSAQPVESDKALPTITAKITMRDSAYAREITTEMVALFDGFQHAITTPPAPAKTRGFLTFTVRRTQ